MCILQMLALFLTGDGAVRLIATLGNMAMLGVVFVLISMAIKKIRQD